ncbi:MAG: DUF1573 domain-containing protein [Lewinella sp.]|nr:DUF1573 domain-containing protein [Lewinella sp.]
MRWLFLLSILWLSWTLPPNAPVEWETDQTRDFGDIPYGEPAVAVFTFRNTGTDSLYIDNVRTSCGCTVPDWQDHLIPPDSTGAVRVEYDGEDSGYFRKWIKVYFNGYRKAERLYIEGYVE